jgi:hypothetical protein
VNLADRFEGFGYVRAAGCHVIEHAECLEVVCRVSKEAAISKGAGRAAGWHIHPILLRGHRWLRIRDRTAPERSATIVSRLGAAAISLHARMRSPEAFVVDSCVFETGIGPL